jgi:hypothetical protein
MVVTQHRAELVNNINDVFYIIYVNYVYVIFRDLSILRNLHNFRLRICTSTYVNWIQVLAT